MNRTRFCINPNPPEGTDPTRRHVLTEALLDEGFVECPPPGEPLPPSLMGGKGGLIDNATIKMAKILRRQLGRTPTEAEVNAVNDHLMKLDPKTLAGMLPDAPDPPQPETIEKRAEPAGAMAAAVQDATPEPAPVPKESPEPSESGAPQNDILHMSDVPQANISESQEDAAKRIFGRGMDKITKMDVCGKAIKALKVELDMSKLKKDLIRDYQLAEIARKGE